MVSPALSERDTPLPEKLAVDPGGEATTSVRVRNRSSVVDQFTFAVLGEPEGWTEVKPPSLSLFPNGEGFVELRFQPPREPKTAPGLVPYGLLVGSVNDAGATLVEEGALILSAFRQAEAQLTPRTSRGRFSGKHRLAVDNLGNSPATAVFTSEDGENALRISCPPDPLVVGPATAGFAHVKVTPNRRFLTGPDRLSIPCPRDGRRGGADRCRGASHPARGAAAAGPADSHPACGRGNPLGHLQAGAELDGEATPGCAGAEAGRRCGGARPQGCSRRAEAGRGCGGAGAQGCRERAEAGRRCGKARSPGYEGGCQAGNRSGRRREAGRDGRGPSGDGSRRGEGGRYATVRRRADRIGSRSDARRPARLRCSFRPDRRSTPAMFC